MTALHEIDGFRLLRELGSGGYGIVFECEEISSGVRYAIKLLLEKENKQDRERFAQEIEIQIALEHPKIVKVIKADAEGEQPYYTMLVYQKSLRSFVGELNYQYEKIRVIANQIFEGLEYAHQNNTLHRDLNPGNILVSGENDVAIADFSLGRIVDDSRARLTSTHSQIGTRDYMPPEHRYGLKNVNHQGDIYSLGLMILELCTGSLDQSLLTNLPEELSRVLDKSIQGWHAKRYANVTEFKEDFNEAMNEILEIFTPKNNDYLTVREKERAGKKAIIELLIGMLAGQSKTFETPFWEDGDNVDDLHLVFLSEDVRFLVPFKLAEVIAVNTEKNTLELLRERIEFHVNDVPLPSFKQRTSRDFNSIQNQENFASNFILERLDDFDNDNLPIMLEAGPILSLLLFPLGTKRPDDLLTNQDVLSIERMEEQRTLLAPVARIDSRFEAYRNELGYRSIKQFATATLPSGYVQLYQTGQIESVRTIREADGKRLYSQLIEDDLVEAVQKFSFVLARLGIFTPIILSIALFKIKGYSIIRSSSEEETNLKFSEDSVRFPLLRIDQWDKVSEPNAAANLLRPVLTGIWEASGQPYRGWYGANGERLR